MCRWKLILTASSSLNISLFFVFVEEVENDVCRGIDVDKKRPFKKNLVKEGPYIFTVWARIIAYIDKSLLHRKTLHEMTFAFVAFILNCVSFQIEIQTKATSEY